MKPNSKQNNKLQEEKNETKQQTENVAIQNKIKELKSEICDLSVQNNFMERRGYEIKEEEEDGGEGFEPALLEMSSTFLENEAKLRRKLKIAEIKLQLLLYVMSYTFQGQIITEENSLKKVELFVNLLQT